MASPSTSTSVRVRDQTKIYLVGYPSHQITGGKLPSNGQVLRLIFYNMRQVGLNFREAANLTLREVILFWAKANIPTQMPKHAINKVDKLYKEWSNIQKSCSRKSKIQEERELAFKSKLEDLFDIAAADAVSQMTKTEDIQFLELQRQKGRPGCMAGVDLKLARLEERKADRKARLEEAKRKQQSTTANPRKYEEQIELYSSSDSELSEEEPMDTLYSPVLDSEDLPESGNQADVESCASVTKRKRQRSGT